MATNQVETSEILGVLNSLSRGVQEFTGTSVARVSSISAIDFLRDYVSCSKPLVITDAIHHWPALYKWTEEYLVATATSPVTVALTPDGRADAISTMDDDTKCFALPYQEKMQLADFFSAIRRATSSQNTPPLVPYLQFQNNGLVEEMPRLLEDIEPDIPWATQAFGCQPEAVNIWMGTQHSITSWHKDHYENMYCQISGSKTFYLLPPTDGYRFQLKNYPVSTWQKHNDDELKLQLVGDTDTMMLWSSVEPREPRYNQPIVENSNKKPSRSSKEIKSMVWTDPISNDDDDSTNNTIPAPPPISVTIHKGEMLYLPACWYHEVHQQTTTNNKQGEDIGSLVSLAVNYWYDMKFDSRYACYKATDRLAELLGLNEAANDDDA